MSASSNIASFIKFQRKRLNLTQEALAERAGVGLRFIRDLEQGKESLRLDKVNQLLAVFGHRLAAFTEKQLDPYDILWNHYNRNVKLQLRNRLELEGILTGHVMEESDIVAWKFLSSNLVKEYKQSANEELVNTIPHYQIASIENL